MIAVSLWKCTETIFLLSGCILLLFFLNDIFLNSKLFNCTGLFPFNLYLLLVCTNKPFWINCSEFFIMIPAFDWSLAVERCVGLSPPQKLCSRGRELLLSHPICLSHFVRMYVCICVCVCKCVIQKQKMLYALPKMLLISCFSCWGFYRNLFKTACMSSVPFFFFKLRSSTGITWFLHDKYKQWHSPFKKSLFVCLKYQVCLFNHNIFQFLSACHLNSESEYKANH